MIPCCGDIDHRTLIKGSASVQGASISCCIHHARITCQSSSHSVIFIENGIRQPEMADYLGNSGDLAASWFERFQLQLFHSLKMFYITRNQCNVIFYCRCSNNRITCPYI